MANLTLHTARPLDASTSRSATERSGGLPPWVAVVVASVAASTWLLVDQPDDPCTGAAPLLSEVWDHDAKQQVSDAFFAADLSYASDASDHAQDLLEAYANAWAAAHRETCEATHVHHTQSDALMELRMACLVRRRDALAATVDVLRAPDAEIVRSAGRAARALPALETCADANALQAVSSIAAEHASTVSSLRKRQAVARANLEAGKIHRGRDLARAALHDAKALGLPIVLADAHALMAAASRRFGQWDEAREHAQAGLANAIAAHDDHTAAALAVELVAIDGLWPDDNATEPQVAQAEAWLERVGSPTRIHSTLLNARGRIARRGAHFDDAIGYFEQSLALLADGAGPNLLRTRGLLAQTYSQMGDQEAAIALFEVNLRATEATLGASHPALATELSNAASVHVRNETWTQAAAYYERALKIQTEAFGAASPAVGATLARLASLQLSAGNYFESLKLCARALSMSPTRVGRLRLLETVGALHTKLRQHAAAKRAYQEAINLGDAAPGSGHRLVVAARYNLARSELASGNDARASALVARALQDLADAGRQDPEQRSILLAIRADLHARAGELASAVANYRFAVEGFTGSPLPGPPYRFQWLRAMGQAQLQLGHAPEAAVSFLDAIAAATAHVAPSELVSIRQQLRLAQGGAGAAPATSTNFREGL